MHLNEARGLYRSVSKRITIIISATLLASCRLVVSTDDTGHIVSTSGAWNCEQPSCVVQIEEFFTDTFTAVPAEGYRFVRWRGICEATVTSTCEVKLVPLTGEWAVLDGDVQLSAVFEPTSTRRTWYRDADGDDFGAANRTTLAFEQPEGFVENDLDCDDTNSEIYPRAEEHPDGVDNDCNGKVDEGFVESRFFIDRDKDGFGDPALSRLALQKPDGYVANKLDCNDYNSAYNHDAQEVVDGQDNDCDGKVDEGVVRYYPDVDGDGYGVPEGYVNSLEQVEGYVRNKRDCDDNNALIHPGAAEEFDSVDNDCDGSIDEGFSLTEYFRDVDGDGFGDASDNVFELERPAGYVTRSHDNCVEISNPTQADMDGDGIGDACDPFTDSDRDEVQDSADNCPSVYNPDQQDVDGDGKGDACDSRNDLDPDGDGVNSNADNCPNAYNPDQSDSDDDGLGDVCDAVDDRSSGDVGGVSGDGCTLTAEEQSMLNAVNAVRSQARVCGSMGSYPAAAPLAWNCKLEAAATGHSMDMANNNFFSHTGSDGQSVGYRTTQAGYVWSAVGENIAAGVPLSSVSAVVQAWVDSPGHCANMMRSSYTELGASKYSNYSSTYDVYWTQVFGRPR